MEFKSVKDLESLVKMLRKEGVDILKLGEMEIVLGKKPENVRQKRTTVPKSSTIPLTTIDETIQIPVTPLDIPTTELTEEQIMFGSSDPSVWETQQ